MAVSQVTGARTVWVSDVAERDRKGSLIGNAPAILAHRYPGIPNVGDITAVDWGAVEPVDIITGGYPCQPFSHAGRRQGQADERHLWPHVADILAIMRPRIVVFENVRGHLTLGFDEVVRDLHRLGYDIRWTLLRASDIGACHQRARLFRSGPRPTRQARGPTNSPHSRRPASRPSRPNLPTGGTEKMTEYNFEIVDVPKGAYIGWGTTVGQHVTGKVLDYDPTGGTAFDGSVCPQLTVELVAPAASFNKEGTRTDFGSGELVVLNAGLVSLKRALKAASPEPGDVVKITLENLVKTANGTVKEMGIKIARGAARDSIPAKPQTQEFAQTPTFDASPPF